MANRPFRLLVQGNLALKQASVASGASWSVPEAAVRMAELGQLGLRQLGRNAMRAHRCTIYR